MASIQLRDFGDLVRAIRNELKIQATDTESINRIKQAINMWYIDEIIPFKRWLWLTKSVDLQTIPFYGNGTASVTPTHTDVTLSVAPNVSLGSFVGYNFSVENYDVVFQIASHTAGSATFTLNQPYTGVLNAAIPFKIWTEKINLPSDCRETYEVRHDMSRKPMDGLGFQEFRRTMADSPKAMGRPMYFNVVNFKDAGSLDPSTGSDRFRYMQIYPSIFDQVVTIHVDYMQEVPWLDADTDEPIIPLEDRIVLYYAALSQLWVSIMRNPEEAARNNALYQARLARMAGKIEEGFDRPTLAPDNFYFAAKRGQKINSARKGFSSVAGGGGGALVPTYAKNITIEGGNLTGNLTANPGITVDGRDVSVDGTNLDSHIAANTNVHGIGVGNAVVGTGTVQTLTNKTIVVENNAISSAVPNGVAVFDNTGKLIGSTVVDRTELSYLDNVEPLASLTLADNQSSPAPIILETATWTSIQIAYSISRGTNIESGTIYLVNNGSSAEAIAVGGGIGDVGVDFSADILSSNVRLLYTSSSTGTAPVMQWKLQKWVA